MDLTNIGNYYTSTFAANVLYEPWSRLPVILYASCNGPWQMDLMKSSLGEKGSGLEYYKDGHANFFSKSENCKSNSWAHSAITNPQISEVCQSANHKSANLQEKSSVSDTDLQWFAEGLQIF
jgi:hypothetical protein